jgi:hypothetical protein
MDGIETGPLEYDCGACNTGGHDSGNGGRLARVPGNKNDVSAIDG